MPKLAKRLPKYSRKGRKAVVFMGGHTHYLGDYDSPESREEYDRLILQYLNSNRTLAKVAKPARNYTTVEDVVIAFWKHTKDYYGDSGKRRCHRNYIKTVLQSVRRLFGELPVNQFGPKRLKQFQRYLILRLDNSRSTVNKKTQIVRDMVKWAVSDELIPVEVHQRLATVSLLRKGRTEARDSKKVLPVADDIVERTIQHAHAIIRVMILIQRLTGCRPGEVCKMRPLDIDRTGEVWIYRPPKHKTEWKGKLRQIAIGPRAQQILAPYLLRPIEQYCFNPSERVEQMRRERSLNRKVPRKYGNRPGTNRKAAPKVKPGYHYTNDSYRAAIQRICTKHGIPKWSPNQLRHANGTQVREEFDLETARAVLGHGSVSTTEIYAEADLKEARRVALQIG